MLSAGSEIVYGVCNNFKRERGEGRERARDKEREREREMRLMGRWCNAVYPSGGVIANQPPPVSTLRVI